MSVLSREEYLNRIKGRLGTELNDDDISLIEDMTDTYDDLNTRAGNSGEWERKYHDLDASWRKKYVDRFNGKVEGDTDVIETFEEDSDEEKDIYEAPKTYADLFSIKE